MTEHWMDCTGEICPIPLIKTERKMKNLNRGDTLIVHTDHNNAISTIPHWARKQGYSVEVNEINVGEWEISIEKG